MGTREDLITAKSLIDTPEKSAKAMLRLSPIAALKAASDNDLERGVAGVLALWDVLPRGYHSLGLWLQDVQPPHEDIMALFDRAIAKATQP